jgi:acyl transferase domain-containing protein/acyl carrier protein
VIGIGCRFPGGAHDPTAFWNLLVNGRDAIVDVPPDRWDICRFYDQNSEKAGKMYVRAGGFLHERIDQFDALFFGISPREALCLDPQQRLLLEVAWEALEDAGIAPERLAGSETGVFIGAFTLDNQLTQMGSVNRKLIGPHSAVSSTMTILSNRLSYVFDFRGPSISIDTACSSSLVALHYACQSLWHGECTLALSGGVNVIFRPEYSIAMCKGQFLSPDGRCKSFDERANGYGRGEGAGIVILKPLHAALQDGDDIYALIRGTGVNQDGRTNGITVPNPASQEALIRHVCAQAQVQPSQICYVEAHGTGTPVGDPIEAQALGAVLGQGRTPERACVVGSVKANIGHLEAASGIAGLIKLCLCLKQKQIPPLANLGHPNPQIPFAELGLRLPRHVEPMPTDAEPIYVGINSFGYGGTNAHAILEAPPAVAPPTPSAPTPASEQPRLLPLSARSEAALTDLARAYLAMLSTSQPPVLADLCYAASLHRGHYDYRLAVVERTHTAMLEKLQAFVEAGSASHLALGKALAGREWKPVFVFTGMGPQWWGMGCELLQHEPVFRQVAETCDIIFQRLAGWSILAEMTAEQSQSRITETHIAQPANFVLQAGLTALWRSWGLEPAAIIGHSVGEVTAAYVAGVLDLEDALRVSYHRSRLQKQAAGQGKMLAVGLTEDEARAIVTRYTDHVSIAAANSPTAVTLVGDAEPLEEIAARLEVRGVFNRFLHVEVPYHSHYMEPLKDELRASLQGLRTCIPTIPLYSTVTGRLITEAAYDAEYWCQNIREPVFFAKAMRQLITAGYALFLEVGPHPVLSTSIKECLTQSSVQGHILPSLRREQPEYQTMLETLAVLYSVGYPVDWHKLYPAGGRYVRLPHYPWQRETYWQESPAALIDRLGSPEQSWIGSRVSTPGYVWERELNPNFLPYLPEHRVEGLVVLPGAAYVEAGLAVHRELSGEDVGVLEDLNFHRALLMEEHDEPLLRCIYDERQRVYAVYSATQEDPAVWTLHATGRLSLLRPGVPRHRVALEAIQERCRTLVDVTTHYAEMRRRGLQYGPYFQGIQHLWRRPGEVLAQIEGHEALATSVVQHRLHPTLLDACFQSLLATLDPAAAGDMRSVYVPSSISQVRFYTTPEGLFWCHGRLTQRAAEAVTGDLNLCDAQGNLLVEVRGLRCQALTASRSDLTAPLEQWTYTFIWQETAPEAAAGQPGCWLVFLDRDGVGTRLVKHLYAIGAEALCSVTPGDTFEQEDEAGVTRFRIRRHSAEDMQRLLQAVDLSRCRGIVYLWGLDAPSTDADPIGTADSLTYLHLIQALEHTGTLTKPRLYVVTEGAQHAPPITHPVSLSQAPLVGLARVALNEHPELGCTLIDLDPQPDVDGVPFLVQELLANSVEDDVALRGTTRYVHRLMPAPVHEWNRQSPQQELVSATPGCPFTLEVGTPGNLDSLRCREAERREPGPGEIEIAIEMVALHPTDGLKMMQRLPAEALEQTCSRLALGMEVAGVITRVGAGVSKVQVGNAVVACLPGGLRSYATVPLADVFLMPQLDSIDAASGASLPSAFTTAYYALHHVAHLQPEETILVHAAAGGISLAAIQVARWRGAQIFATAATPEARDALRDLGITNVMDSGSVDFVDAVLELTNGRGVDVILNAFGGAVTHHHAHVLAPFGRCIELGRRVPEDHDSPAVFPDGANITVATIDMERLMVERPTLFQRLLHEVWEHVRHGDFTPLPTWVFPITQVSEAFHMLAASHYLGKIVLALQAYQTLEVLPQVAQQSLLRADRTYLISGGFGGFGQQVAAWMAAQGARHLVLVGRRGAATPGAQQAISALERQGAHVMAAAVDIAQKPQVVQLLTEVTETMPPLGGIVHAAGVLEDSPLTALDAARFMRVMQPKALGAWYLHDLTQHLPLDFFMLFSSITCLIGNARQGNYAAANAFLDALAQHRRAQGQPATSINWGALAEVGMASHAEVEQHFKLMGMHTFTPAQAMDALTHVLRWHPVQVAVLDADWHKWGQFEPVGGASPRFRHLTHKQEQTVDSALRQTLLQLPPEARHEMFAFMVAEQVAETLRLPTDKVEVHQSPVHLGMDSLMAVELQAALSLRFGVEVSTLELMRGNTIGQMAEQFMVRMGLTGDQTIPQVTAEPEAVLAGLSA